MSDKTKAILLKLVAAETAEEIDKILETEPFFHNVKWVPFGGTRMNFNLINGQMSDSVRALVEKPINSIDAILLKECKLRGIDPKSRNAPTSMKDAIEKFFDIPGGDLGTLNDKDRKDVIKKLIKNIVIIAVGKKDRPTIIVVDKGEGQNPQEFPNTLLSLSKENKVKIQFVQGKYNMGGTGVLPFCAKGYQLIVSKKPKELLGKDQTDSWGFTLVRKQSGDKEARLPFYEYFIDQEDKDEGKHKMFNVDGSPLPLFPNGETLEYGTYIKMFNYELQKPSLITSELWLELNRAVYSPPLPFLIWEARKCFNLKVGKNDTIWLYGNRIRVFQDSRKKIKDKFSITAELGEFKQRKIEIAVFKDVDESGQIFDKKMFTSPSEAIFLTINGQTHGTLPRSFIESRIGFSYLKDYIMIHIDLSDAGQLVNEIFMANRETIRNNITWRQFQDRLAEELRQCEQLREYDELYRQRELARNKSDETAVKKVLEQLLKRSPALAKLFGIGVEIPIHKPGKDHTKKPKIPYTGSYIPTFLKIKNFKQTDSKPLYQQKVPINKHGLVMLETDAQNDYLDRDVDKGELIFKNSNNIQIGGGSLSNGIIPLRVYPSKEAKVGSMEAIDVELTRPGREPLSVQFNIELLPNLERLGAKTHKKPKPNQSGYALPKIREVYKSEWANRGWNGESISEVTKSSSGGYSDVYVNMDAEVLHNFIETFPGKLTGITKTEIQNSFKYAIGLLSLSVHIKLNGADNTKEIFNRIMLGAAEVLLPMLWNDKALKIS